MIEMVYAVMCLVAYVGANSIVALAQDLWASRHNTVSLVEAMCEIVQEHIEMHPTENKLQRALAWFKAYWIVGIFTIPVLIKLHRQHVKEINVKY